jgi:hypothetical protein
MEARRIPTRFMNYELKGTSDTLTRDGKSNYGGATGIMLKK